MTRASLLAVLALFPVAAFAQPKTTAPVVPEHKPTPVEVAEATEAENPAAEKPWSIAVGLDTTTAYFFRGYNVEDSGYIFQPSINIKYTFQLNDDWSLTPGVGNWDSFHQTASPDSPRHWFESDYLGSLDIAWRQFTFTINYVDYTYPGNAAGDTQEVGLTLAYDDSAWAEKAGLPFSFQPHLSWFKETADENGPQDQYMEIGITPSLDIPNTRFNIEFPLLLGFSTDSFFTDAAGHNEFFGFFQASATLCHPLPLPDKYGAWTIRAGVDYLYLSADSLRQANDDTQNQFIGRLGLTAEF